MSDTERRLDLAREVGALSEQVKMLAAEVRKLSEKMSEFTAIENKMKGAKWLAGIVAGAMAAFLSFAWWALAQLEKLMR